MPRTRSDGWTVRVTHPETDRTLTAETLSDPQVIPSLKTRPRIRIPVPADPQWLALPTPPDVAEYPSMTVYRNGVEQPIDDLRRVDDERFNSGVVVLEGIGGPALEARTTASWDTIRRHEAARELIAASPYQADVDDPETTTRTDQLMQLLETTADFEREADVEPTDPVDISSDSVTVYDVAWPKPITNFSDVSGATLFTSTDGYESGSYLLFDTVGQYVEFEIDIGYEVDKFFLRPAFRARNPTTDDIVFTPTIDGEEAGVSTVSSDTLDWNFPGAVVSTDESEYFQPGTHTVRWEVTTVEGSGQAEMDIVGPGDLNFISSSDYTNTLSSPQGYLDGPPLKPDLTTVLFNNVLSAFAVVGGSATIDIDDTSDSQFVGISNDLGDTWTDANNSTSVSTTFANDGAGLRARVGLSNYSPNGAQSATPRFNYDAQTLSRLETRADIEEVLLLIDEDFDDSLESVLNQIAGDEAYVWSYNHDDTGTPQISWTQPGQRETDRDPDIGDVTVSKDTTTYPSVTIKGSPTPVSGERFAGSESFVDLQEAQILVGSETVYDPSDGTNYSREEDYRIDREQGRIRIVGSGDMSAGTTYAIDYRHEISGSYTLPSAPADPNELVRTVPGVTSQRQAEQVAFVLANDLGEPRYTADLQIPRDEVTFDPLEALSLSNLDLPADAVPLEPRGEPEITPRGLSLRLGSRARVEALLSDVSEQLSAVSDRV